jgi:hypothetical protein
LNLSDWYNQHSDFFYDHIYGDKDTFRLAWHKVGQPYSMPSRDPEIIPFAMCQHGFAGERLFQHRVHDKWSLIGNRRVADFWLEATCRSFVDELRRQWDPMIWQIRGLSSTDRQRSAQLVGTRFDLERIGFTRWQIELGPRGYLVRGQSPHLCFWWCEQDRLVLAEFDGRPVCNLAVTEHGEWFGPAAQRPREHYRLVAV